MASGSNGNSKRQKLKDYKLRNKNNTAAGKRNPKRGWEMSAKRMKEYEQTKRNSPF